MSLRLLVDTDSPDIGVHIHVSLGTVHTVAFAGGIPLERDGEETEDGLLHISKAKKQGKRKSKPNASGIGMMASGGEDGKIAVYNLYPSSQ